MCDFAPLQYLNGSNTMGMARYLQPYEQEENTMKKSEQREIVPVWEKTLLSLEEASAYTGIGVNKLRNMSDDPSCEFVLWVGSRRMLKRTKLEEFVEKSYSV